jgi:hypothetical protein
MWRNRNFVEPTGGIALLYHFVKAMDWRRCSFCTGRRNQPSTSASVAEAEKLRLAARRMVEKAKLTYTKTSRWERVDVREI